MSFPIEVILSIKKNQYWYLGDASGRNSVKLLLAGPDDVPIDITVFGEFWTAQLRQSPSDKNYIDLLVDDSEADQGVLVVSAPPDSLKNAGDYIFDVQVTGGEISPFTVWRVSVPVVMDVTR